VEFTILNQFLQVVLDCLTGQPRSLEDLADGQFGLLVEEIVDQPRDRFASG